LGLRDTSFWVLEHMAGMPRVACEALRKLDNQVQRVYHPSQDRLGIMIALFRVEMEIPEYSLIITAKF
jgi:hypothetical protein